MWGAVKMRDEPYRKAVEYVFRKTKDSSTRVVLLKLLERIWSGEKLTLIDVKKNYPQCYSHILNMRKEGLIHLVKEKAGTRGVLKLAG